MRGMADASTNNVGTTSKLFSENTRVEDRNWTHDTNAWGITSAIKNSPRKPKALGRGWATNSLLTIVKTGPEIHSSHLLMKVVALNPIKARVSEPVKDGTIANVSRFGRVDIVTKGKSA